MEETLKNVEGRMWHILEDCYNRKIETPKDIEITRNVLSCLCKIKELKKNETAQR